MAAFFKKVANSLAGTSPAKNHAPAPIQGYLDLPSAKAVSDPLTLNVEGWVLSKKPGVPIARVDFYLDGEKVGETSLLHPRPDVAAIHHLPPDAKTGFARVLGVPAHARKKTAKFAVQAVLADDSSYELTARQIPLTGVDYRLEKFGFMLDPADTDVRGREQMFGSGPSLAEGSKDLVALLKRELGSEIKTVLDVGCGLGFYGKVLRESGYEWMGVEVKPEDARQLELAGLPHVLTRGDTLPFPDKSYDGAICIEVLEHIEQTDRFLREIARVVRQRVLFSVPNAEIIPYLTSYATVPLHMLEADHKNFFSRASLEALLRRYFTHAEVQLYALCPLKTNEGAPLHYNLFAIAENR
jgi:SAM-dependent methyltransferase